MLRAAIFDLDGVLIDSEHVAMDAWIDATQALGLELTADEYEAVVGLSEPEARAVLTRILGGPAAYTAARSRVSYLIAERTDGSGYPLKPGARELLGCLHSRNVPCAVASSSRFDEIRGHLEASGIVHRFVALAGGDEVVHGKPAPDIYNLAVSRLGVSANTCAAFEDSENGAKAALACGARVVLVPDVVTLSPETVRQSLDVIDSLEEAVARIPRWFGGPLPSS